MILIRFFVDYLNQNKLILRFLQFFFIIQKPKLKNHSLKLKDRWKRFVMIITLGFHTGVVTFSKTFFTLLLFCFVRLRSHTPAPAVIQSRTPSASSGPTSLPSNFSASQNLKRWLLHSWWPTTQSFPRYLRISFSRKSQMPLNFLRQGELSSYGVKPAISALRFMLHYDSVKKILYFHLNCELWNVSFCKLIYVKKNWRCSDFFLVFHHSWKTFTSSSPPYPGYGRARAPFGALLPPPKTQVLRNLSSQTNRVPELVPNTLPKNHPPQWSTTPSQESVCYCLFLSEELNFFTCGFLCFVWGDNIGPSWM